MTLKDLINIVEAISEEKLVLFNYRLQKDGRFNKLINGFGSPQELHSFLIDVLESEPASFTRNK